MCWLKEADSSNTLHFDGVYCRLDKQPSGSSSTNSVREKLTSMKMESEQKRLLSFKRDSVDYS
jgi:hypothetical protein